MRLLNQLHGTPFLRGRRVALHPRQRPAIDVSVKDARDDVLPVRRDGQRLDAVKPDQGVHLRALLGLPHGLSVLIISLHRPALDDAVVTARDDVHPVRRDGQSVDGAGVRIFLLPQHLEVVPP